VSTVGLISSKEAGLPASYVTLTILGSWEEGGRRCQDQSFNVFGTDAVECAVKPMITALYFDRRSKS
jgi:hypothetical protein